MPIIQRGACPELGSLEDFLTVNLGQGVFDLLTPFTEYVVEGVGFGSSNSSSDLIDDEGATTHRVDVAASR